MDPPSRPMGGGGWAGGGGWGGGGGDRDDWGVGGGWCNKKIVGILFLFLNYLMQNCQFIVIHRQLVSRHYTIGQLRTLGFG